MSIDLSPILGAVQIHEDGSVSFPANAPAVRAQSLIAALTSVIYSRAFARGIDEEEQPEDPVTESELARRLTAANQSRDRWIEGWRIEQVNADGSIVATQGRRQRVAKAGQYSATFARDLPPRTGMAVTLYFPRQSLTLQSHVYYAFGDALPGGDAGESRPARIYIQSPAGALPELYERLTGELNRLALPFTLKTMLAPGERNRRDATVLYVQREDCARAEEVIGRLPSSLLARLGPDVPLFTRRLGPGIGMAESPGGGESFGMQRSRLVAEGIADAWAAGRHDVEERTRAVHRRFQAAGIDWNLPHLATIVLTASNIVDWLRSQGIAGDGQWHVTDRSSRNRNFAVERADGSGYFVKQLRVQQPASLRMMERESAIYEAATTNDSLRQLMPPFVRFDPAAQAVVFGLLPGAQCVAQIPGRGTSIGIARAAAHTLAQLHRQPSFASELLDRQPPGIYTAHRGGPLLQWLGPGQMQIIDRVRTSPILAPELDQMAAEWRAEKPIHGDVKWENCLWTAASAQLHWIDWELADNGDPLWDAGCFVQTYIAQSITSQSPLNLAALDAFIDAYDADARHPIVRCAAARLIQSSLEVMHGQPAPTSTALALFNAAERIMASSLCV
ncbi:MAG: T3SS effector HopA1 family protein [Thermoanaerobaculia bacterium]